MHERGPHGGYSLTRPTTDITLGDVVAALRIPAVEVHPNPRSTDELSRSMSRVWKQVEDSTLDILTSITVAQVVEGKACGGDPMMPASPMEGE